MLEVFLKKENFNWDLKNKELLVGIGYFWADGTHIAELGKKGVWQTQELRKD